MFVKPVPVNAYGFLTGLASGVKEMAAYAGRGALAAGGTIGSIIVGALIPSNLGQDGCHGGDLIGCGFTPEGPEAVGTPGLRPGDSAGDGAYLNNNGTFVNVDTQQLGKKLGKHVSDFGGNPSSAEDRQRVIDIINDIGVNPDKIVSGTFAGQGVSGNRGSVDFRIKGNDVVVTKPDGTFVTILKDGINNTSVKNALEGNP